MLSEEHKSKIARFSRFSGKERVSYLDFLMRQQNTGKWTRAFSSEECDLITGARPDQFDPLFFGDTTNIPCPWRDDAFLIPAPDSTAENRIPSNTAWVCFGAERGMAVTQNSEPMNCDPACLKYLEDGAFIARKHGNL